MLNYENVDAILFDMDGTIFDSEVVHREAWKITAKAFEQEFTDASYLQFIGMTTPACMQVAMSMFNHEVELDKFSAAYYVNLEKLVNKGIPVKKGFLDYFNQVKALNKPLAIVTSSAKSGVEANFLHYDFLSAFEVIVTRDDVTQYKPKPEPYLLACKKLGIKPERTIVFEDSNTGATAAIEAGCSTVGIADLVPFYSDVKKHLHLEVTCFSELLGKG